MFYLPDLMRLSLHSRSLYG